MLSSLLRTALRPTSPSVQYPGGGTRAFSILRKAARRRAAAIKQEEAYIEQKLEAQLADREAKYRVLQRIRATPEWQAQEAEIKATRQQIERLHFGKKAPHNVLSTISLEVPTNAYQTRIQDCRVQVAKATAIIRKKHRALWEKRKLPWLNLLE